MKQTTTRKLLALLLTLALCLAPTLWAGAAEDQPDPDETHTGDGGADPTAQDPDPAETAEAPPQTRRARSDGYYVTYDAGRGTGGGVFGPYPPGVGPGILTAAEAGVARIGHTFAEWNTAAYGSGYPYSPGDTITMTADLTLYAQWEYDNTTTVTLTFDPNGGTGSTHTRSDIVPGDLHNPADGSSFGFLREGYSFVGWNTAADGSGVSYNAYGEVKVDDNMTLYAMWEGDPYTVEYYNEGLFEHNDQVRFGDEYTVKTAEEAGVIRKGFLLLSWTNHNTSPSYPKSTYAPGETVTIVGNLELYAGNWQYDNETTFTVTYDANGGVGGSVSDPVKPDDTITIVSAAEAGVARKGHDFTGWNYEADGGFHDYPVGRDVSMDDDLILYAQWVYDNTTTVSITYHANGGEGGTYTGPGIVPGLEDTVLDASAADFSRTGHDFTGWNTAADGSGDSYSVGDPVKVDDDMTLYAIWTPVGGGSTSGSSGYVSRSSGGSSPAGSTVSSGKRSETARHLGGYSWSVDLPRLGFQSATVDGDVLVKDQDYTVRSGSTILTLTDSYVSGLNTGSHTLRMEFLSATATIDFTVMPTGAGGGTGPADSDSEAPVLTGSGNDNRNPSTGGMEATGSVAALLAVVGCVVLVKPGRKLEK